MKKTLSLILSLVMIFALCACGQQAAPAAEPAAAAAEPAADSAAAQQTFTVGICQLVQHEALDAATQGFKDALVEELGDAVVFDEQNAAGDIPNCSVICNSFVSNNVDLIMANATPALQAAVAATDTIPVLGTSITEYGVALDIDGFNGLVGGNISGTSDLAPLDQQAQMILDLFPDTKTVGVLFCSAEANSVYQVKVVSEFLEGKGVTVKQFSFADSNDVSAVTTSACAECDALFIPTDNTAASCAEAIGNITEPANIPVFTGEEGPCKICGVATLTIDYYSLGQTTGKMAAKILKGEADISEMEIEYFANPVKKFNPAMAEAFGLELSSDFVAIEG